MNYIRKYCFTCQRTYEIDERHPHRCVMEDARREFTLEEIRSIFRSELRLWATTEWPQLSGFAEAPRPACDGDILLPWDGTDHFV